MALATVSDSERDEKRAQLLGHRFIGQPRLRRYRTFSFGVNEGKTYMNYKQHDATNRDLKEIIKLTRKDGYEKTGLPLPINKVSRLIGVWHGKRVREYRHTPYYYDDLIDYSIQSLDRENHDRIKDKGTCKVFPGSWGHNSQNLIDMCTLPKAEVTYHDLVDSILSRVGIDFFLPYIGNLDLKNILGQLTSDASSGLVTSMKISKNRKLSTKYTKFPAYIYAKHIMNSEKQILDSSLYQLGGREKRIFYKDKDTKKLKTRAIFMQEDIPTLIGQSIGSLLNQEVQRLNKGHNWTGRGHNNCNYEKVIEDMSLEGLEGWTNCNTDFSGHDNHVTEEQIVTAFAFIRQCFKVSGRIDRIFYYVMSSMVSKRIVLPESNLIYQIIKGVPSGHALTSQVTTLAAYNIMALAIFKKVKKEDLPLTRITNAGDDTLLRVPVYSVKNLDDYIQKDTPMFINSLTEHCGTLHSENPSTRCTFLKKKFYKGMFSWNEEELYTNLICPTYKKLTFWEKINNLKDSIYQAPLDLDLNQKLTALIVINFINKYWSTEYNRSGSFNRKLSPFRFIEELIKSKKVKILDFIKDYDFGDTYSFVNRWSSYHLIDLKKWMIELVQSIEDETIVKTTWFTTPTYPGISSRYNTNSYYSSGKKLINPHYYGYDIEFKMEYMLWYEYG